MVVPMDKGKAMEWQNIRLSEHFTLWELCRSKDHPQLVEPPLPIVIYWLKWWARDVLEPLRKVVGRICMESGYRNLRLNKVVGGGENSIHQVIVKKEIEGVATDITTPDTPLDETFRIIAKMIHLPIKTAIIYPFRKFIHIHGPKGEREFFESVERKKYFPLTPDDVANYRLNRPLSI